MYRQVFGQKKDLKIVRRILHHAVARMIDIQRDLDARPATISNLRNEQGSGIKAKARLRACSIEEEEFDLGFASQTCM